MLVAVISDTHLRSGGRPLPGWCLERVRQADQVLHAGDVVEPFLLAELGLHAPVAAVAGNVDAWQLRSVLPAVQTVELDGVSIGMLHDPGPAAGREERLLRRFPDCQAVVFGHTHMPVMHEVAGRWLLNPGSPTQPRRAPRASMLVLAIEAGRLTPELVWAPDTG